jgi:hypothetical protein
MERGRQARKQGRGVLVHETLPEHGHSMTEDLLVQENTPFYSVRGRRWAEGENKDPCPNIEDHSLPVRNSKHEKFAENIAIGMKQGAAYIDAGYSENKGAASRLSNRKDISGRVDFLRQSMMRKLYTDGDVDSRSDAYDSATLGISCCYAMSNPAMPGIYKVGRTKLGAAERARQLSASSSVPLPYEVVREMPSALPSVDEKSLHDMLGPFRINQKREFFSVDLGTLHNAFDKVADKYELYYTAEVSSFCQWLNNEKGMRSSDIKISIKSRLIEVRIGTAGFRNEDVWARIPFRSQETMKKVLEGHQNLLRISVT